MSYLAEVLEMGGQLEKGQVHHFQVAHDDDCSFWKNGICNCRTDISYMYSEPKRNNLSKQERQKRKKDKKRNRKKH